MKTVNIMDIGVLPVNWTFKKHKSFGIWINHQVFLGASVILYSVIPQDKGLHIHNKACYALTYAISGLHRVPLN